jgi:hypothetical protein
LKVLWPLRVKEETESFKGIQTKLAGLLFRAIVKLSGHYTEGTKREAQDPKVEKILKSNLLSGGLSLGHLSTYSADSIAQLKTHAELLGENKLIKALNEPAKEQKDPVIHEGNDADVDLLIDQLQKCLKKQRMKYQHYQVGGNSGM